VSLLNSIENNVICTGSRVDLRYRRNADVKHVLKSWHNVRIMSALYVVTVAVCGITGGASGQRTEAAVKQHSTLVLSSAPFKTCKWLEYHGYIICLCLPTLYSYF
jgi:hypothetical protein